MDHFVTKTTKALVEAAVRIAQQGCGKHYNHGVLAPMWRTATREQWARLAVICGKAPPDRVIQAEVISEMERLAAHTMQVAS